MKLLLWLLGVAFIVVAGVYLLEPANSLPSFFPGYDTTMTGTHLKHGLAAGALGVVLILAGWFVGRSRS